MTRISKTEFRSTAADNRVDLLPERTFWCNLTNHAISEIRQHGDRHAIEYIKGTNFELVAFYLGLNAEAIRERVLSPKFRNTSSKRVYKNV